MIADVLLGFSPTLASDIVIVLLLVAVGAIGGIAVGRWRARRAAGPGA